MTGYNCNIPYPQKGVSDEELRLENFLNKLAIDNVVAALILIVGPLAACRSAHITLCRLLILVSKQQKIVKHD